MKIQSWQLEMDFYARARSKGSLGADFELAKLQHIATRLRCARVMGLRRQILCLSLFIGSLPAFAQLNLQVQGSAQLQQCLAKTAPASGVDSLLNACVQRLRARGWLEMSIDSVETRGDTLWVLAHEGSFYQLGSWHAKANLDDRYGPVLADTLPQPRSLDKLELGIADYLKRGPSTGYPFSRIRFDSLRAADSLLHLRANTWSGPLITYGGVRFAEGVETPVSITFLNRYLRLEPGRRYRQQEIDQVGRRLKGISYLELVGAPIVAFESGQAYVYLNARARKTSRFDFLLGFLPNSDNNNGQLLLTGDANLQLDNALRKGERLSFSFERLQPQSTEVELAASYPYLFSSPFGARVDFGLYRQQEDWLRVNYEAGLVYAFGGADSYELYYEGGVAQSLSFDTARVRATQVLPNVLDVTRNGFGARLRLDRRDDALDTRKGFQFVIDASAAFREVSVPRGIRDLGESLVQQADSIQGRTGQFRASLDLSKFQPLGRRTVALLRVRAAGIFGGQQVLRNELYRIGGQRLLRGFDEQSIDAQGYGVATLETRLLLGGGSFLFVFTDQGLLYDPYRFGSNRDAPTGFGAGLRLGTAAGALSLTYAYGKRSGAPVDWQRAKIHIGFESRF